MSWSALASSVCANRLPFPLIMFCRLFLLRCLRLPILAHAIFNALKAIYEGGGTLGILDVDGPDYRGQLLLCGAMDLWEIGQQHREGCLRVLP
jgi:hypothetical protein